MTSAPGLCCPAVLVEAFSASACGGNGAAVVLLEQPLAAAAMQAIARSLNQSETAFLLRRGTEWLLRWFTPTCEVPLCGHATLAALLALGHWGEVPEGGRTVFHTRSGPLAVRLLPSVPTVASRAPLGELELPRIPLEPHDPPPDLRDWLQERPHLVAEACWRSPLDYTVVLLPPDAPLATLEGVDPPETCRNGLVLMQALPAPDQTAPEVAGQRADYQLRFFAPGLGIDEDPVTG
ncbi:MAG: PhzF family phenazine biosynthesis protein, partial [Cyanobium sp.]